jgi:putative RNA 2'-phosphotransferase
MLASLMQVICTIKMESFYMDLIKVSRYLSLILRHKPEQAGITLDEHGWANVEELIKGVSKKYPITIDILEEIVATDDKQRYSFSPNHTYIRANQGHSVPVDVELEVLEPPEYLYHGTGMKYYSSIMENGLIPKSRLYVHLTDNVDAAMGVGARHGDPVVFCVDAKVMHEHGFVFYKSVNGVWLTERVPNEFLLYSYADHRTE